MASNTYVALSTQTLGSAVSSVTFSSIPQGYTDLVIVANFSNSATGDAVRLQVGNGSLDTASNYSGTWIGGNGSAAGSSRETNQTSARTFGYSNGPTTSRSMGIIQLQNYSNTNTNKTIVSRYSDASGDVQATVSLWRSTAAINTLKLFNIVGSNFTVNSTFTIYGVAAVPQLTAKATGGTIYYGADGYVYHKFTGNGSFVPSQNLSVDYLVIAGGGSGGATGTSGGGGAGGLLSGSTTLSSGSSTTCTIGAGGASNTLYVQNPGVASSFGGVSTVGGAAGGNYNDTPTIGGSGGGAVSGDGTAKSGGAATSGQGYAGGNTLAGAYGCCGGGGAGGPGATLTSGGAYNYRLSTSGGPGSNAYSTWLSVTSSGVNGYIAGGGGGGGGEGAPQSSGGLGGGGVGSTDYTYGGTNGVTNTGSGGGGNGGRYGVANGPGSGSGGSGIIIVRYLG